jgi:signal peptidase
MKLATLVRTAGTILTVAFAAVGILLVVLVLFVRTEDNGVTRIADRPIMTVLSDSMTPEFEAGDVLIEKSVTGEEDRLAVGDVITFRIGQDENDFVTHRIVRVKGDPATGDVSYRTQGDANNTIDASPVTPEQVVGVYATHVPNAGYVLDNLQTPQGLAVLVFLLGLFVVVPMIARSWRAADDTADDEPKALESV